MSSTALKDRQEVSMAPAPEALIESLRSIGYTLETALADIIDNSISADASEIEVRFLWDHKHPWIAVVDNGSGMAADELRKAMRFGSVSPLAPRGKTDLGRFGLGLKTASISQCRKLTVCSKRSGSLSGAEWDLDIISQKDPPDWILSIMEESSISEDELLSSLVEEYLSGKSSGTIVLWRNLDAVLAGTEAVDTERKFSELLSSARKHIETVFHRFLSADRGQSSISISFNKSPLLALNPFGPNIPARQELTQEKVKVDGQVIEVQPYILPHKNKVSREEYDKYAGEGGYLQNQGFYVYRNRRLIVKATWFRLIKKEELNKLIRVRIDIPNSLDHLWAINVDKSEVTPPEIVRKQLRTIINKISGRGKLVYKRKAAKLKDSYRIAIWNREVKDGKIHYTVNLDHPLISRSLEDLSSNQRTRLETSLKLIADSFPTDLYYNDAADDDHDLTVVNEDSDAVRDLCIQLIEALKICGIAGTDLEKKLLQTEIPGATDSLKLSLINEIQASYG